MDAVDRAKAKLTLTLDWPEITLQRLSRAASLWSALVDSVSASVTGSRSGVKWVLTEIHYGSPLRVESVPASSNRQVDPATVMSIGHAVVDGLIHLETRPDPPEHFSIESLGYAGKLAKMASAKEMRRIVVSNGTKATAALTSKTVSTVADIFGPVAEAYGSVEGYLEGVLTHGQRRFYVYEALSGRQVRCLIDEREIPLETILAAYEKRVIVSGLIRSKAATGEKLSIRASGLRVFEPDNALPTPSEILELWSGRK